MRDSLDSNLLRDSENRELKPNRIVSLLVLIYLGITSSAHFSTNSSKPEKVAYSVCILFLTFSVLKEAGKEGDENRTKFETLLYSITLVSFLVDVGFFFYRFLVLS
jgi:hypothetical protein